MYSGRQLVLSAHGRGVTVYLNRRGELSFRRNENADAHMHRPLSDAEYDQIVLVLVGYSASVLQYLTSLPHMCGQTPFGHNSMCFAKATHVGERAQLVNNKYISADHWYYCEDHVPPPIKLKELRIKCFRMT